MVNELAARVLPAPREVESRMTRISEVKVALHRLDEPFTRTSLHHLFGVLTIVTESGVESTVFVQGQARPEISVRVLADFVRPQLIGRDALDIGAIWQMLWRQERSLPVTVIGAVDTALWDIAGKVARLPIHRLLGTVRHSLPIYVSSWVHERPEDYAAEAAHYQAEGFAAYKIHPPTQWRFREGRDVPLSEDIRTVELIREAVGPDMKLMSDSPFVYSYEEALTFGRVLQDLDFYWYEDPLPSEDTYGYERLRRHLYIPILATEMTAGGPYTYPQWIRSGATDYLRGDVAYKGGITPVMKIAHTAEVFGMNFEQHDAGGATANLAAANIAMALPNTQFYELLTPNPTGTYGFDLFNYGLAEPMRIVDGHMLAPTGPGLGHEIDHEVIERGIVERY